MAGHQWLADPDNRDAAYQIAQETLVRLQPAELPLLEGLFTNYVALAQDSDVQVGREHDYGFGGGETLMSALAIQLAIDIVNTLLIAGGMWTVKELIDWWRRQRAATGRPPRDLAAVVKTAVAGVARLSPKERRRVEASLLEGLKTLLGDD